MSRHIAVNQTNGSTRSAGRGKHAGAGEILKINRHAQARKAKPLSTATQAPTAPIDRRGLDDLAPEPDSAANLDRLLRAQIGRLTRGLSPPGLLSVYFDWLAHVALSPGKQYDLLRKMGRKALRFGLYAGRSALGQDVPRAIEPLPQDRRFDDPAWQRWPFNLYYQSFLFAQQWLYNATTGVRGVSRHGEQIVTFAGRQLLDFFAPTNFVCTNPEVLRTTVEQKGRNFVRGLQNFLEDRQRKIVRQKPKGTEGFQAGETVAVTPGKVIFRNRLIELIQYAPQQTTCGLSPC